MTGKQNKSPPQAAQTFTSQDADRILGFADQFLEDWQLNEAKDEQSPAGKEVAEIVAEFRTIRPLLVAAPQLLAVAELALNYLDGQEYLQACAIIANAKGWPQQQK
jgi:hypothetical protein